MGIQATCIARVSAGAVKTKDANGNDLGQANHKYPCYMAYMGGQIYAGATAEAHQTIQRATGGNREGVDMLLTLELSKFKEDTMIRIVAAEAPGGANPGVVPDAARRRV